MSKPGLSIDEEALSPDLFSDVDTMLTTNNTITSEDSSSTSIGVIEPEPMDDVPEWKGMSMDEIRKGLGTYDFQEMPPICPSSHHTILISLPLPAHGPPKPYPTHQTDKWSQGYVRMPHSKHSLYPIEQGRDNSGNRRCRNRWEIIQESLLQNFVSTQQLEAAIFSYNHKYAQRWNFSALHHFFSETMDEEETNMFFEVLMPKMVQLALQLPVLITGPIPLLKRHTNGTITLSQLQIASLIANAFFCTFPRRNSTNPQSEYGTYPYINFNRLFWACNEKKSNRCDSVMEKMKCIFHYFRRVTTKAPEGVVTIQRRYIPKQDCPKWDRQNSKLPPLHITSKGTIEEEAGLLQVDFANKYVGGAVLGFGCVQEEIRFAICPELIVTMLVTEELDDTEALIVTGVERYSKYEGYSNSFKWMGDFVDETPKDSSGRRLTSIVAIDALSFKQAATQFSITNITRELNKAYVGFVGCEGHKGNLPPIATGNWGCGAFRGNPKLKVLLQLMAAAVAGRSMVYFTFGDTSLRDDISEMYCHLVQHDADIAHLFSLLAQYQEFAATGKLDFYHFLHKRGKIKPLSKYFLPKNKSIQEEVSSTKETVIKKSRSLIVDDKRISRTDFKRGDTEEERIESWLANFDDDFVTVEKSEVSHREFKDIKSKSITKIDQIDDSAEKKKKQSFWKLLEDKVQSKTVCERRSTGLESLDAKQELITNGRYNDFLTANKQQTVVTSVESMVCEPMQISSERSIQPQKYNSPVKKGGQKKISDFFQRTS